MGGFERRLPRDTFNRWAGVGRISVREPSGPVSAGRMKPGARSDPRPSAVFRPARHEARLAAGAAARRPRSFRYLPSGDGENTTEPSSTW